jgi:hypothetical protein
LNVAYREVSAVFLHLYRIYVLSVDVFVINGVYTEISAVYIDPYKTYVLSVVVHVTNILYCEIIAVLYICTLCRS